MFNKSHCVISKIYCGDNPNLPPNTATQKYSRKGTRYECMKRGVGIGMWTEKKKNLPANSLQQITYVGEVFEENFVRNGMTNQQQLINKFKTLSPIEKQRLLEKCCKKRNGVVEYRAYNHVLLFLHDHDVRALPPCTIISE